MRRSVSPTHLESEPSAGLEGYPLMVFTPAVGAASETFIQRHAQDLLPGGTATLAWYAAEPAHWAAREPYWIGPVLRNKRKWRVVADRLGRGLDLGTAGSLDPGATADASRFIAACRPRVILSEYLDATLEMLPVFESMAIPVVAHGHGYDFSTTLTQATWRRRYPTLNRCKAIVVPSRAAFEALTSVGVRPEKLRVIPYGIDIPSLVGTRTQQAGLRVPSLLMVGRLVPKKDPLLSIQAFTEVARVQRVELHVVGDGPLLQEARQLAVDLGIRKLVHFHGALGHTAVQEHFKHADIFLQHSRTDPQTGDTEGLPVAILEAMAHGLPVVSTNHAGIPEAVINGETGLLVEEGDLKGMVGSLLTLVSDTGLRQRLGSAARARTAAKFSWRTERRQLLKTLGLNAPDDEVANAGP